MRPTRIRLTRLSRRVGAVVPQVATPPVTANLYARYDASAVNGLYAANPSTDGTALSSWKDLSGNGRDLSQATAANQPLFRNASRNLLTYNQGATCEDGTTTGFIAVFQTSIAASVAGTDPSDYGAYSLAVTPNAGSYPAQCNAGVTSFAVTPGQVISGTFTARAKSTATPRVMICRLYWYDSNNNTVNDPATGLPYAEGDSTSTYTSTTAWTQFTCSNKTVPVGAVNVRVVARIVNAGSASDVHFVDKFGLFAGTVTTWTPPITLLNNQPTVQFDGNLQTIFISSLTLAQPFTIYAVARAESLGNTTSTSDPYIFGSSAGAKISYQRGGGSQPGRSYANAGSGFPAVTGTVMTTSSVVSYVFDNTSQSFRVNGVAGTAANAGANGLSGNLLMGGAATANTGFMGGIAAVLIYSAAHDTTTRQSIERWLGARYGITVA